MVVVMVVVVVVVAAGVSQSLLVVLQEGGSLVYNHFPALLASFIHKDILLYRKFKRLPFN